MSMDTWDTEDFVPPTRERNQPKANQWDGEDEEEEVMESWDQEPEEIPPPPPSAPVPTDSLKASKKSIKKLGEKFEEKERKRKEEQFQAVNTVQVRELTSEEKLAEKLRQKKLQEDADLALAKEVFGTAGSLESKSDYDTFKEDFLKKINSAITNSHYANFVEEIVHSLCLPLNSSDLKKIHNWIGNLHIEKNKMERGEKSKKSKAKGKAKLKMDSDNFGEYQAYTEDFDDF